GSLRWAITQANANPGPDTIDSFETRTETTYDLNLQPIGTHTERYPVPINLTLGTQLPTITDDLTIIGNSQFTVSGNNQSRVLEINPGVSVNISEMTITHGFTSFGGVILINLLDGFGGGIHNQGNLTLTDCTISNNFANGGG